MIKKWLIVPVMGYIWLLALLYSSGIGQTIDIYGKTKYVVITLLLYSIFVSQNLRTVHYKYILLVLCSVLYILYTTVTYDKNMADYLWIYLLIPLIAILPVEKVQMNVISVMYGVLGMAVLVVTNYASYFDGWNPNSIAMVALFSFCVMIATFNKARNLWIFIFLGIYTLLYFRLLDILNCRSGRLFAIFMLLCVFGIIPIKKMLKSRFSIYFIVLIPLFVAIFLALTKNFNFVLDLNSWSIDTFSKRIFNGRDELCYEGFKTWLEHPFFGNGDLGAGNWHNSAVTMLVGGGIAGFTLCIIGVGEMLKYGSKYLDDTIVAGLVIGFITIWLQQSVELGLIAPQCNAIPYAMLGLLIGRIKTIKSGDFDE